MKTLSLSLGRNLHVEIDTFGIFIVAGGREIFWQSGLGLKNVSLILSRNSDCCAFN